jgi:DNA-binding response OmpR family regulator
MPRGKQIRLPQNRDRILDPRLPLVDGFGVLNWLRAQAQFAELKVVVLSGSQVPQDEVRARVLGADGYFAKDPRCDRVMACVSRILREPRQAISTL